MAAIQTETAMTSSTPGHESQLTVICAWCGTVVREGGTGAISHGICVPCRRTVLRQFGVVVQFADGRPAGSLGQISDLGFELIRPRGEVHWIHFSAILRIDDEAVRLACSEETMEDYRV
jgi:hypothetical protein